MGLWHFCELSEYLNMDYQTKFCWAIQQSEYWLLDQRMSKTIRLLDIGFTQFKLWDYWLQVFWVYDSRLMDSALNICIHSDCSNLFLKHRTSVLQKEHQARITIALLPNCFLFTLSALARLLGESRPNVILSSTRAASAPGTSLVLMAELVSGSMGGGGGGQNTIFFAKIWPA